MFRVCLLGLSGLRQSTSKPRSVAVAIPVTFNHPAGASASPSAGSSAEISPEQLESLQFLVISSRRHAGKYVFPKVCPSTFLVEQMLTAPRILQGGIEEGETASQAAIRETYEEAGLTAKAVLPLCDYSFISPRCHEGSSIPRASYQVSL